MLLRPFVYQPRQSSGYEGEPYHAGRLVIAMTIVVTAICLAVTAFAADLPLPSRDSHRTRPVDPRCNTAARYDAMREAYELRLPDPCNGATRWRR